ncbi:superoxide dismutase [Radiobacillus sp. PE A8.2]|uniref:superoxide dismutase n=1 Tax=Radiobacillus sp. PE A8.2 TaxID=3380349 RepID=UPI00388FC6BA
MNSKQEYLSALLEWAEKVESQVSKLGHEKQELTEWKTQFSEWKALVQKKIDKDDITDNEIIDLQQKSQKLIYLLAALKEQPRQQDYVAIGNHRLPPLPYKYNALEPYIAEEIMRLHHDKHHQSYVDGLNKAEKELYKKNLDKDLIKHWMREQAFNGSGHYLHTIFWFNMSPRGGGKPSGSLLAQINKDFGSFQQFKQLFSEAAKSVEGVGWAILVWQPRAARLGVQTVEKHQMFSLWDVIPLLVLDVWEHAYYLQYQTKRGDYVNNWWNVVNWEDVQGRFAKAKTLEWPLF